MKHVIECNNLSILQIVAAINDIPVNFTHLQLQGLFTQTSVELAEILAAIPLSVNYLYLDLNCFGRFSGDELAYIFIAIPSSVFFIDLSNNNFHVLSSGEMQRCFSAIPEYIKIITLWDDEIEPLAHQQIVSLGNALPHVTQFIVKGGVNEKGSILQQQVGEWYTTSYQHLNNIKNIRKPLPSPITLEILSFLTPMPPKEVKGFVEARAKKEVVYDFHKFFTTTLIGAAAVTAVLSFINVQRNSRL